MTCGHLPQLAMKCFDSVVIFYFIFSRVYIKGDTFERSYFQNRVYAIFITAKHPSPHKDFIISYSSKISIILFLALFVVGLDNL